MDLLTSDWSPFRKTTWTMPLLDELSDRWRHVIDRNPTTDSKLMTFVADFPGFFMENSMRSEWLNVTDDDGASLEVLEGELLVETSKMSDDASDNVTVLAGETIRVSDNIIF